MARVRIQTGGKVLITIVVLGALLFLFFEFKPAGKTSQPSSPAGTTRTANQPAPRRITKAEESSAPKSSERKLPPKVTAETPGPTTVTPTPTTAKPSPATGTSSSPIRIYFAFNRAHVNKNVYCIFDRIQALVRREGRGGIRIVVEGNADSIGAPWYNVELSRRRAARVADSLSKRLGVPASDISLVANGSTKPIATNSTRAGRADNRRTDIIIYR